MDRLLSPYTHAFLQGRGELAELTRRYDWAATSLGDPGGWPQSLRTTLGILLRSRFPMFLFWGPEAICFYNDAYRPSLGNNGKHPYALGKPGAEVWPEIWPAIGPQIAAIMEGGEATWHEDQLLPIYRNGQLEEVYWTYSYSPVLDESGRPAGVFVTCTETTATVQGIQELQQVNEKARLAIEAGDLGVVEVDLHTESVTISPRIQELFGLANGSLRTAFYERMHPDDLQLREEAYQRAYRDGRLEYESRVYHPDGPPRWIRLKGTIFFEQGQPSRMLAVVQDITAQKEFAEALALQVRERTEALEEAHRQLLESNTYLQRIINIFTTPLQVLEPVEENGDVVDFRYKLTNEAYSAYAGASPAALVGRKVSEFFPGYFSTDSFRNIREVARTGETRLWDNHYCADGLDIYNEMGAVKMDGDVVVHLTDFTKLKQLQLDLERNITELRRSNANLEEFAHAASHDLKEPIRKIHFFTGMLKEQIGPLLNDTQRSSFERIEKATGRMSSLIDDLLLYSHVSQRPREMEPVDLQDTVARVLDDLELDIRQKEASVLVDPLPTVNGHRRQLQQLFQNLISNALKYSKPGVPPQLRIEADRPEAGWQRVTVSDNGIGFDETYRDKIFQMFARLHGKGEYSGTGVGLSIVKKVVENHEGKIVARGVPGEGAAFELWLPG